MEDLLIKLLAGPSLELRQHWAEEICQVAPPGRYVVAFV